MEAHPLAQLRQNLALARADLRDAQDAYKLAKAYAEQDANVDGKNESERARKLAIALSENIGHTRALGILREIEYKVDRLEAAIESQLDDRRAWEWSIRSALVDALGQAGNDDGPAFDAAMDEETFTRIQQRTMERLQRQPLPADAATDTDEKPETLYRARSPLYDENETRDWYGR